MSARQLSLATALAFTFGGGIARADVVFTEQPRSVTLEFKLGGYKPLIDREASLTGKPYDAIFGGSSMLLFEGEIDKIFWQKFGTAGLGFSIGYAEKYAPARVTTGDAAGSPANESTSLKVIPIRLLAVYRLDYGATHMGIPLVPYGKAGLVAMPWWTSKGGSLEFADGNRGAGTKFGYCFTGGLSLMLDFLEPRMAKDFSTDVGVSHSYLFGEYVYEEVNTFGKAGLDLSSRHFMFGFAMDF
jgi:hypothetical protein